MDLWQFTPLHEAASKSRTEVGFEICLESKVYNVFQVTKFIHAIGTDISFLLINALLSSFSVLLLFCSHRLLSSSTFPSCSPFCSPLLLPLLLNSSAHPSCSILLLTSPAHNAYSTLLLTSSLLLSPRDLHSFNLLSFSCSPLFPLLFSAPIFPSY